MTEKESIVNLGRFRSKGYTSVVLGYSEVTFVGEMFSICLLRSDYIRRWNIRAECRRISLISILLGVFHQDQQLFLIFLSTTLSSSCVNCPSLMSSWLLIIFVIGSFIILGDFPRRFLKCSFHKCIRSSWVASFDLALAVLFILLTSFTVFHAILDCLSSTESLTQLIQSWMYSVCSLRYALVSTLSAFLCFWALECWLGFSYCIGMQFSRRYDFS